MKILDTRWINQDVNVLHPGSLLKGQVQILVDAFPKFIYQKTGNFYWAEKDGLMSVFEYKPKETDGFGGRHWQLEMIDGQILEFKGTLWDSYSRHPQIPTYRHIGATDKKEVWDRGHTFYSEKLREDVYNEIIQKIVNEQDAHKA